jgi:REP element-mobilizing transposase RayT
MIMAMRYRSTHKMVYSAKYQLIGRPKSRRRAFGGVDAWLEAIIAAVAAEADAAVTAAEVMPDHVHSLGGATPPPLSRLVGLGEGLSWWLLRMAFPRPGCRPARWSLSWVVPTVTVGGAPLVIVRRDVDVANQRAASPS